MPTRRELLDAPSEGARGAGASLDVAALRTSGALESLRAEWAALWARVPNATPFQSPAWLLPWWRHFGGSGLWALTLRRAGRLVGLAPFFVHADPATGQRQVTLLGNGLTDHLDVLVDPESGTGGATVLLEYLARHRAEWDSCDFRDLPAASPLRTCPCPEGLLDREDVEEPCPTLLLPPDPTDPVEALPPRFRAKLRYYERRADRLGPVRVDVADERSTGSAFDHLLALHSARWASRSEPGVLEDAIVRAFHRDAMLELLTSGWLRLYTLRIHDQLAAVLYGFLAQRRAYYYLGGFAPAFGPVSPGSLLVLHAVRAAARDGAGEFDFLRGREPYKYAWGAVDRPQFRRRFRHA